MRRAKANALRTRRAAPIAKSATDKAATEFDTFPMSEFRHEPSGHIDWNSETLEQSAQYMADELTSGKKLMKLLQQPAGTGKTAVAVKTIAEVMKREPNRPVVILASRAIIDSEGWQRTIAEWNADNEDSKINPVLIDTCDRFTNILNRKETREKLIEDTTKQPLIVIDEVHNYKNPTAKRSKALQKLPEARVLGLSATPLTNQLALDMASYLIIAGFYRNKSDYIARTGLDKRFDNRYDFHIYNDRNQIDESLWPKYPVVLGQLSTVLHQPDVSVIVEELPSVSSPMHRIPQSEQLAGDLRSIDRAYRKRMFDSAADYVLSIQERVNTDPDRIEWLVETIRQPQVKQPLIFYWHIAVRDAIATRLNREGIAFQELSGSHPADELDLEQSAPILVQYQAGGEGIEFPASNASVFFENQGSYARLVQARGRNVRLRMKHQVTHFYCVSDAPFDTEMLDRVLRREELSEKVLAEIAERVSHP